MYEVWLSAIGADGAVLLRADGIFEISTGGPELSIRIDGAPDEWFVITEGVKPAGSAAGLELLGALRQAHRLAEQRAQPQVVAAVLDEDRLIWTIEPIGPQAELRAGSAG